MTFETFLDGLNKGGFAFLGMVLVAAILIGLVNFLRWLFSKGWPDLLATLGRAAETQKESLDRALAQSDKVLERQSMMQDNLMASHTTIVTKLDTVVTKLDGISDKVGGKQQ